VRLRSGRSVLLQRFHLPVKLDVGDELLTGCITTPAARSWWRPLV